MSTRETDSQAKLIDLLSQVLYKRMASPSDEAADFVLNKVLDGLRPTIKKLDDDLARVLCELFERVLTSDDSWKKLVSQVDWVFKKFRQFNKSNPDPEVIQQVLRAVPDSLRSLWSAAAGQGWFVAGVAPFSGITPAKIGGQALDDFMIAHIDENFEEFVGDTLELCPERGDILRAGFDLHRQANYVASIPLFLAQSDGICSQHLHAYLFSESEKRRATVKDWSAQSTSELVGMFLSTLVLKTQFGAPADQSSEKDKLRGPNRNGILHGSRKHLDYATKLNSYKALSLLFSVTFILSEQKGILKEIRL